MNSRKSNARLPGNAPGAWVTAQVALSAAQAALNAAQAALNAALDAVNTVRPPDVGEIKTNAASGDDFVDLLEKM